MFFYNADKLATVTAGGVVRDLKFAPYLGKNVGLSKLQGKIFVKTIKRSQLVPFSAKQMYELVDGITQYQTFLPWCVKSEELERDENSVTATLTISAQGLEKSFTTKNTLTPHSRIDLSLVDGPFSHLDGHWLFIDTLDGCKVDFELNFDIANKILAMFIGPLFEKVASSMLDAFCDQAQKIFVTNAN